MSRTGPKPRRVALSGDLTMRGVGKAHGALSAALSKHPSVVVAIDPAAAVDLTFVQLIYSARKSAADADRDFALAAPASDGLLEVLRRGGFLAGEGARSFWLHDGEAPQ